MKGQLTAIELGNFDGAFDIIAVWMSTVWIQMGADVMEYDTATLKETFRWGPTQTSSTVAAKCRVLGHVGVYMLVQENGQLRLWNVADHDLIITRNFGVEADRATGSLDGLTWQVSGQQVVMSPTAFGDVVEPVQRFMSRRR